MPFKYRAAIREGILEWNKAYEMAGFVNAIEVRQQPDDATWDPEDINYNTFRWITAEAGFAMGPSRVNPLTGEILDADIIFDAGFVEAWSKRFELAPPKPAFGQSLPGDLNQYTERLSEVFTTPPNATRICSNLRNNLPRNWPSARWRLQPTKNRFPRKNWKN